MRQPTKLTASSVDKLKPENTRYEVADTEIPGFRVRVTPSGVKTYALLYRNQEGKRQRFTIGKHGGLATVQARKIASQTLAKVKLGKDPQHEKRTTQRTSKIPTVAEFVNGPYAEYINSKQKRPDMTLHRLNAVFSQRIKDTPLDELTAWNVEKWRQGRIKSGKKPVTINRDIAALRSAYSTAISWDIIDSNPLSKVKAYKIDNSPKVRYLSEDEEARLLNALNTGTHPHYLKPMVILSLNTGLRRGEVFNLKWHEVDLNGKLLTVSGAYSKSGKTRHVPLNSTAIAALSKSQKFSDNLVFCNRKGEVFDTVKKSWATLLKQAQITKFRWHDMRHHFASKLVMAGVDLNTVRELLGHSDIKMTLRYAHLAPEHKAAAVAKIENINNSTSLIQAV